MDICPRIAVASALLLAMTASCATADWPMFRGNARRSGTAESAVIVDRLAVQWNADIGGSVDSSPAVIGGQVLVGNSLGQVAALSAEDGSERWRVSTDGAVVSSPAVSEGTVVFGSADRFIYAVDADSGEQQWRFRTGGAIVSSPVVSDGRVIAGSMDGHLYCLDMSDGSIVWRSEQGPGIQCSPAIGNDLVLYGDDGGSMYALRLSDGSLVWEIEKSGRVVAAPVIGGEVAVFGVMGPSALRPPKVDYLLAVRTTTGEQVWALHDNYSVLSAPLIAGERVFFATVEGYLSKTVMRSANLADGELVWERRMPGVIDSSPALLENQAGLEASSLCVGCHDGRLYLLNPADGAIRDVTPLAQKIYSSPAVSDGRIFIGADDGCVYCLSVAQ